MIKRHAELEFMCEKAVEQLVGLPHKELENARIRLKLKQSIPYISSVQVQLNN